MLLLNINVSVLNYVFIFSRSVREGKKARFIQEEETEERQKNYQMQLFK